MIETMIGEELGCDIKENPELSDIWEYDTITYGGGTCGHSGFSFSDD